MLVVGIDENGLGLRNQRMVGPLVVTATAFRMERDYDFNNDFFWDALNEVVSKDEKDDDRLIVSDSKEVFKSGSPKTYRRGESTIFAFYSILKGRFPKDFDTDLLSQLVVNSRFFLSECGIKSSHCRNGSPWNLPTWGAEIELVRNKSEKLRDMLRENKIELVFLKSKILCPFVLHKAERENLDKYWCEAQTIADFVNMFLEEYGAGEISVFSGKIDGWGRNKILDCFSGRFKLCQSNIEDGQDVFTVSSRGKSLRLHFVKSGDKTIFAIALSSIFGKYIREIFIKRINEFFQKFDDSLDWCAGYDHGRKFDDFIKKAVKIASMMRIPKECLLRERRRQ